MAATPAPLDATTLTAADIKPTDNIRTVGPEHVTQLGAITADAFRHDPFNNWLFTQQKRKHQMFTTLAKYIYAPNGFCQILSEEGEDLAATMWMLPGGSMATPVAASLSLAATFLLDSGWTGMKNGFATGDAMEKHHPKEPHVYLFTVGVIGAGRGRGLGRRLIESMLDACDRTGTMAYLENSNPANTRVYNSLGFESIGMIEPVVGCPPLEAMKRTAR